MQLLLKTFKSLKTEPVDPVVFTKERIDIETVESFLTSEDDTNPHWRVSDVQLSGESLHNLDSTSINFTQSLSQMFNVHAFARKGEPCSLLRFSRDESQEMQYCTEQT